MFLARYSALAVPKIFFRRAYTLPDLPYEYNALEPVISEEIMQLHYCMHHASYVNNYNTAEEKLKVAIDNCDLKTVVALLPLLRFNGGGHINHTIFWKCLSAEGGNVEGDLRAAIQKDFGSICAMKKKLSQMAVGIQGSGWAWLGYNKPQKRLEMATCANQDPLEPTTGLVPILGIDVWEHAYYLQYKHARAEYVNKIWDVMNWKNCEERYCKLIYPCGN